MEKNRDGHKLLFKGEEYRLGQLHAQVKTAPPIEVKLDDLNLVGLTKLAADQQDPAHAELTVAKHEPVLPEYVEQFVVFYKQEGKFTVLLGHIKVRQALEAGNTVIKGKLISGPVLKKCRIEKEAAPVIEVPPAAPAPQFNAPRVVDRRNPSTTDSDRRTTAPRRGLENNRPYGDRTQRRAPPPSNNRTNTRGDFRKS
jgi:hypothetical protein